MRRSKFSLSNTKLLSCNMGDLVPVGIQEVLPGDTFQHGVSALIRTQPLLAPVMHPVIARFHTWFVPTRLVWDNWEPFITGGSNGEGDGAVVPTMDLTTAGRGQLAVGSLGDYFGLPTAVDLADVSALPFRAYATIFNEFYRDQDLVTELTVSKADGNDTTTSIALQKAAWEKDYFTSARSEPQKGPDVSLPLGSSAPVVSTGTGIPKFKDSQPTTNRNLIVNTSNDVTVNGAAPSVDRNLQWDDPELEADLSSATAATVNELREAMAIQRFQERMMRTGSRYTEYLRGFGINPSDARLQRPEYLGGGKQTIQFSEVLQTSNTTDGDDTEGVGNMKGHGMGGVRSNRYRRFFEEHGFVITLMSLRPKTMYMQGVPRMWSRSTKEAYWQQELQHIGQQEVLNKEVYAAAATPSGTFGWQDRYDEYRRSESTVAGEFRDTLDYWHMARKFASEPALNSAFVTMDPTTRIYPATTANQLYVMVHHSIQARRLVAKTGSSFIY